MRTQQERTIIHMNMHLCNNEDCYMDMWPIIEPSYAEPNELVTFKVYNSHQNSDKYVHFFMDDYQFERIWNTPEKYLPIIKRYKGAISPNFSTYTDMPIPMQIWNVYRSRMIARYWQLNGIDVIPCVQYSNIYQGSKKRLKENRVSRQGESDGRKEERNVYRYRKPVIDEIFKRQKIVRK